MYFHVQVSLFVSSSRECKANDQRDSQRVYGSNAYICPQTSSERLWFDTGVTCQEENVTQDVLHGYDTL